MIHVTMSVLYVFLAALELVILLGGLTVLLALRYRRSRRRIAALEGALREARSRFRVIREKGRTVKEAGDYVSLLEEQIRQSRAQLGEDVFQYLKPAAGEEADDRRRLLAVRQRFLELEHHAQQVRNDPRARETHWAKGLEDLLSRILPASPEPGPAASQAVSPTARASLPPLRDALREQMTLIEELRGLLETELTDSAQAEEILTRLEQAEAHAREMEDLLAQIEAGDSGEGHAAAVEADQLRRLVGSQEDTIAQLEGMVQGLLAGQDSPQPLGEMIERIQRTNRELGTCVTVLEDENARLRDEIAGLQERVAELEAAQGEAPPEAPAAREGAEDAPPGADPGPAHDASPAAMAAARAEDAENTENVEDAEDVQRAEDADEVAEEAEDAEQEDVAPTPPEVASGPEDPPVRVQPPEDIDLADTVPADAAGPEPGEAGDPAEAAGDAGEAAPSRTGTDDAGLPPRRPAPSWTRDL
ncbi:MAG: hypothetical protein D6721_08365 [Gammaproteobacteria bacterium]|nr:MAG: hypothetical protein D6721_08365 [Gammaproteobacteria bacterium]